MSAYRDPEQLEQAVFGLLLEGEPGWLSEEEVIRAVSGDAAVFAERDAVLNALRELVGSGLAHRNGLFYGVTRAAVSAARLLG